MPETNDHELSVKVDMLSTLRGTMKTAALTCLRQIYGWRSELRSDSFRYIFIVGHQRSGSSMLTQIICSHPDVSGFGESRTFYRGRSGLRKLRGEVFRIHYQLGNLPPLVLDKVLFAELLPDVDMIDGPDIHWLFLLRDPIRTMRSMIEMFGDEESQLNYYRDRIAWLCEAAEKLHKRNRSFFTTYDQLIQNTEGELNAMTDFFGLDPSLTSNYELQPRAGKAGVGDSSNRITAGTILRQPREHPFHPEASTCEFLLRDYERALFVLSRACKCTDETREFVDGFSSESELRAIQSHANS